MAKTRSVQLSSVSKINRLDGDSSKGLARQIHSMVDSPVEVF